MSTFDIILHIIEPLGIIVGTLYVLYRMRKEENRRRQIRIERRKAVLKARDEEIKRYSQEKEEAALIQRLEERSF